MIENIEQAKERFKRLVDFYKLNDPNNYDYDDRDLISMKLVLEEIERLNNIINKAIVYLESYNTDFKNCRFGEAPISIRELGDLLDILKGSDKE